MDSTISLAAAVNSCTVVTLPTHLGVTRGETTWLRESCFHQVLAGHQ